MKEFNEELILENWIEKALGLKDYNEIIDGFKNNKLNEKKFNSFYKLIWEKKTWKENYHKYMKKQKGNNDLTFEEVLIELQKISNNNEVHPSFASKLLHTINPQEKPIWDKYIIEKFNLKIYKGKYPDKKFKNAVEVYKKIEIIYKNILNKPKTKEYINFFNQKAPKYKHLSDIKKLDFLFWSIREENISEYFELDENILNQ